MTRTRGTLAALVVALLGLIVVSPAAAAPPAVPPWEAGMETRWNAGALTRWRATNFYRTVDRGGHAMQIWLSDPRVGWVGAPNADERVTFRLDYARWQTEDPSDSDFFIARVQPYCVNPATEDGRWVDDGVGGNGTSQIISTAGKATSFQPAGMMITWENTVQAWCTSDRVLTKIRVVLGYLDGSFIHQVFEYDPLSLPQEPGDPDESDCVMWFYDYLTGDLDPYATVVIGGRTYYAYELGCADDPNEDPPPTPGPDDPECAVDFNCVCAGAPQAEFFWVDSQAPFFHLSLGWLPHWVGHYARCLFIPGAGFDTTPIGEAADDGWMGASRNILASVTGAFGGGGGGAGAFHTSNVGGQGEAITWADDDHARALLGDDFVDGLNTGAVPVSPAGFGPASTAGCGNFVEELPVIGDGVSSCALGEAWPDSWRTGAGAVVMIMASFATLFGILRFMGVRYGWSTG